MPGATMKPAGTFQAVEIRWSVAKEHAESAQALCARNNWQPRPYSNANGMSFYAAVIPLLDGDESMDATCNAFEEMMKDFGCQLYSRRKMTLFCPPPPEMLGWCPRCGNQWSVIIDRNNFFVLVEYPSAGSRCTGSGGSAERVQIAG